MNFAINEKPSLHLPVDNYVKIILSTLSADVCEIFSVIRSWFGIFYYCKKGKVIGNRSILFRENNNR